MRHPRRARTAGGQRRAQVAKDLAIPPAFSMSDLQQRLERYSGRAVQVSPAELGSGSPSGFWFRKNGTDYLFYEQHASPFHQAHIVLGLAAHALLADAGVRIFDPRLTPDVGIALARLMLGNVAPSPLSDVEADDFAFLALRSACRPVSWFKARRSLRRLEPLRCALLSAVPQAARAPGYTALPGVTRRLCQAVVEIREAALALRPFRDPEVGAAASDAGRAAGLAGRDLAAAVEAAVLADAIRACHAGEASRAKPGSEAIDPLPPLTADLACDVDWLIHLSRAFRSKAHRIRRER